MGLTILPMKERIGTLGINNHGFEMIVVDYNNSRDILVQFIETGNIAHTKWEKFKTGNVNNPYEKSVYGIGFIGVGNYTTGAKSVHNRISRVWHGLLQRCYGEKWKQKYPTYEDCEVCDEWHNFQNFAKWYDDNYYEIDGEKMNLDKDILFKGNKIYSPETCVFVPQNINKLFVKSNASRGNLPIGVHYRHDNAKNKYRATCRDGKGKQVSVGQFSIPYEAFMAYKLFKEKVIKEIANDYREKIPIKLYNALMKYEVEITD